MCFFYLQNDTMNIVFVYHEDEPQRGLVVPGSLPNPSDAFKSIRPMFLLQRVIDSPIKLDDSSNSVRVLELRNEDAELPEEDNSIHWCKMFKVTDIQRKHHIIRVSTDFLRRGKNLNQKLDLLVLTIFSKFKSDR